MRAEGCCDADLQSEGHGSCDYVNQSNTNQDKPYDFDSCTSAAAVMLLKHIHGKAVAQAWLQTMPGLSPGGLHVVKKVSVRKVKKRYLHRHLADTEQKILAGLTRTHQKLDLPEEFSSIDLKVCHVVPVHMTLLSVKMFGPTCAVEASIEAVSRPNK